MNPPILLVTDSKSDHANRVERELLNRNAQFIRLDTDHVLDSIHVDAIVRSGELSARIVTSDDTFSLSQVAAVWWFGISPPDRAFRHSNDVSRRWVKNETVACLRTIIEALDCHFTNHPVRISAAQNKVLQLSEAASLGFKVPETIISSIPEGIRRFSEENPRMIFKTLSHPEQKTDAVSRVCYTSRVFAREIQEASNLNESLNLFQNEIEKDVEYRVTVVGESVLACEIHSQENQRTKVDWRRYNLPETPHYPCDLPTSIARGCLEIVRRFGLSYGAIDLARDTNGSYYFIELNPNGLWAWIEILTGLKIAGAIADHLVSHASHQTG